MELQFEQLKVGESYEYSDSIRGYHKITVTLLEKHSKVLKVKITDPNVPKNIQGMTLSPCAPEMKMHAVTFKD